MNGLNKRHFKFYMDDPEFGDEYSFEETIDDYDHEYQEELEYLLDQFKKFLLSCGYSEVTLSHLQFLEDKEWKYVLQTYGEWKEEYKNYIRKENM